MAAPLEPHDERELAEAIGAAAAEGRALEIVGHGTKAGLGREVAAKDRLETTGLKGIVHYEPGELVMEAEAGTPLAEIEQTLAGCGQRLAFEPPDLGPLYGAAPGEGTIGGALACNLSGPRRPFAGAARDHVLGIRAVSGRGEVFASGGRVVKNVTGYDMSKLLTGSYGTLAVFSRLTFKVLPRPESAATVLVYGLTCADGAAAMAAGIEGPLEVSAAAHLPGPAAARSAVDYVAGAGAAVTALRLEGSEAGVAARRRALIDSLAGRGEIEGLEMADSATFWAEVGRAALLPREEGRLLWRLSVPPAEGAALAAQARAELGGEALLDWGGGLVWLALPEAPADEAPDRARTLRRAAAAAGGHATLIRAPAEVRAGVPVFTPEPGPLARLTRRLKANFDPSGILNPGRMFEGV